MRIKEVCRETGLTDKAIRLYINTINDICKKIKSKIPSLIVALVALITSTASGLATIIS